MNAGTAEGCAFRGRVLVEVVSQVCLVRGLTMLVAPPM